MRSMKNPLRLGGGQNRDDKNTPVQMQVASLFIIPNSAKLGVRNDEC